MTTGGPDSPINGSSGLPPLQENLPEPSLDQHSSAARMGLWDVTVHPVSGVALEGNTGAPPPYVPIQSRNIEIEEISGGAWEKILGGLATGIMKMFDVGSALSTTQAGQELKKSQEHRKGKQQTLQAKQAEMESLNHQINRLRSKIKTLNESEQKHYVDLKIRLLNLTHEVSGLKYEINKVTAMEPILKTEDAIIKEEVREGMASLQKNMTPGLKLLMGLRKVFSQSRDGGGNKVFHINLGELSTTSAAGAQLNINDIGVYIERCQLTGDGDLVLDIADIQATLSSLGPNNMTQPMRLSGGVSIRLRPPASTHLYHAMTVNSLALFMIPRHVYKLVKALQPVFEGMFASPPTSKLSDIAEVSINGLQIEKNGQVMPLMASGFGHALLDLFIPLMNTEPEPASDSDGDSAPVKDLLKIQQQKQQRGLEVWKQTQVDLKDTLANEMRRLEEDFQCFPEGGSDEQLHSLYRAANKNHQQLNDNIGKTDKKLEYSRQAQRVSEQNSEGLQSAIEMARGLIDLAYDLVQVARSPERESPVHHHINRMKLPVSEVASMELRDLKVNLSGFSFSDDGVAELGIAEMASHVTIENEDTHEQRSVPVKMGEVKIKINPPFGRLLKELLTLAFPLDSKKVEDLVIPIIKEIKKNNEAQAPYSGAYTEITIGSLSCMTPNGEVFFSGQEKDQENDQDKERKEEFIRQASDLLAEDISSEFMGQGLQALGINQETQQKLWELSEALVLAEPGASALEKVAEQDEGNLYKEYEFDQDFDDEETLTISSAPDTPTVAGNIALEPLPGLQAQVSDHSLLAEPGGNDVHEPVLSLSPELRAELPRHMSSQAHSITPSTPPGESDKPMEANTPFLEEGAGKTGAAKAVSQSSASPALPEPKPESKAAVDKVEHQPEKSLRSEALLSDRKPPRQKGLTFRDLSRCQGVIKPRFEVIGNQRTARFEMKSPVATLFGKLSGLMRYLVGRNLTTVEVALPIDPTYSEVQLDAPSIQLKSRSSYNPFVWLEEFLLRRRLKNLQFQLELDYPPGGKRLSLVKKSA